ncbi:MAG: beta-lactamase family protein [Nocardioidaceae bacterium]|nr:beta-lactamase family protein [Nocardioidaceae bacterium]
MEHWQAVLDQAQSRGRLPSIVGAVLRGGELTWTGSAGSRGGLDQQYRIGSITKTLTAVLVMQARDDGLLALDEPLGSWIPESGYADATLRSLLRHTSGMQSEPAGPWWERSPGVGIDTLLARNDGSGRVFADGVAFHYSNLGFALLGEVVARVRGTSWFSLVQERLLEPLAMSATTYDAVPGRHAQGYSVGHFAGTLTEEPHEDTVAMAPAGQLWSTIADLARWLTFLAAGHPDVLAPATLAEMSRVTAPAVEYGLGLRVLDVAGRTLVGHTGSMPGFLATAFVERETGDGVVALSNATTGLVTDQLARTLVTAAPSPDAEPGTPWEPSTSVPPEVEEILGLWFWGNSAHELRWHNGLVELRDLSDPDDPDRFALVDGAFCGVAGYHLGETLDVHRDTGTLECATFVYTRTPYPR